MPDWIAWCGVAGTFAFGGLSVWQLIQYLVDRRVRDANKKHMLATKFTLQSLRQMCAQTTDVSAATRQWVNHMSLSLLSIEHHIDAFLEAQGATPEPESNKKLREVINNLIISGNDIIQRIKIDPGVAAAPGFAKDPSPEVAEMAEKWVSEARKIIDRERHEFLGRFDSVDDFPSLVWVSGGNRSNAFNTLIERIVARLNRLGELLSQI